MVEFPITTTEVATKLLNKDVKVLLKGGTVVNIQPPLEQYPMATHEKYKANKAPMKKTTRFVSKERFVL